VITDLQTFSELKSSVKIELERLHKIVSHFSSEGEQNFADEISHILQRLASDSFKVLVVGEFSTGKSTFLNAMLGQRLLPTDTTETTATINIIKYGENPTAIVHYWGERDQNGREASPCKKETIKLEDLHRYITSLTKESNEVAKTVKFVEIYLPSKYCSNSVELVDTPGLNTTYEYHELTTLEYLQNGHFGIMVLNATQFLTASEIKYLERFRTYMNKVMFVVNYVNEMPPGDSFEDNKQYFQRKLKKTLTSDRDIILYPVNALMAEQGDHRNSGLDAFLKDFETFLTSDEKTKEMLLPPIIQATNIIKILMRNNNIASSVLCFSRVEFEKKVEQLLPKLQLIRSKQNDLLAYLDRNQELIIQRYTVFAEEQMQKKAFQIKNEIAEWPGDLDSLKEELSDYLKSQTVEVASVIEEFVKTEIRSTFLEVRTRYNDLLDEIADYQDKLISLLDDSHGLALEKLFHMGEFGDGEGENDFSHLALLFGGSFTTGFVLASIFSGPIGLIVAMLGSSFWGKFINEKVRLQKLSNFAQQVYKKFSQQFKDSVPEGARLIRQTFRAERNDLGDKLRTQLDSIQHTIDSIQSERDQEESKVLETKKRYENFSIALADIQTRLVKVKNQLIER
jgi:ribosome biogenesis GTPase A/gas vesicle protein